ncbi:MAG: TonB-dependent receptor, partial [Bacteroidia bacterium]|nr:TonB-dependent receptor [Bacteroidia bacterium]
GAYALYLLVNPMLMKHGYTCCLLLFLALSGAAQTTLEGSVYDRSRGTPLRGAQVSILPTVLDAMSGREGFFVIRGIQPGIYRLRVECPGFTPAEREIVVREEERVSVGIALTPAIAFQMREEVVTPQRFRQAADQAAGPVSVLPQEVLSREGVFSLQEALAGTPGLWINRPDAIEAIPVIRGQYGAQNAVVYDGIRLTPVQTAGGLVNGLSLPGLGSLDQVEVSRGSSASYGGATGGTIQFIPRTPHYGDKGIEVHTGAGLRWLSGQQASQVRGELSLHTHRVAVLASGARRMAAGILPGGADQLVPASGYQTDTWDVRVRVKISPQAEISLVSLASRSDQVFRPAGLVPGAPPAAYTQTQQLSYARLSLYPGRKWLREGRLTAGTHQVIRQDSLPPAVGVPVMTSDALTGFVMAEVMSQPIPYWRIQTGVEHQDRAQVLPETSLSGWWPADAGTYRSRETSVFTQHTLDILKLRLAFGGRVAATYINPAGPEIDAQPSLYATGSVTGQYPLQRGWWLYAGVHSQQRGGNLDTRYLSGEYQGGWLLPAQSLLPGRYFTTELGLRLHTATISGQALVFQTRMHNSIVPVYQQEVNGIPVFTWANASRSRILGVEAEAEAQIHQVVSLTGAVTYTYTLDLPSGSVLTWNPPVSARIGIRARHRSGIWGKAEAIGASARTQGPGATPLYHPAAGAADAWLTLNCLTGWNTAWGFVTAGVYNLMDTAYQPYGQALPGMGRRIALTMQVKI